MSTNRTVLLAVGVLWMTTGCGATELTEAGQQVHVGKADPGAGCKELGTVYGSGGVEYVRNSETEMTSAQNELRNRAGKLGATYVSMDAIGVSGGGTTISGRAFHCEEAPAGTPVASAAAVAVPPPAQSPEERLTKLKELLDKGMITQTEYDRKRAEIIQSL
jgi:hypothetical protein